MNFHDDPGPVLGECCTPLSLNEFAQMVADCAAILVFWMARGMTEARAVALIEQDLEGHVRSLAALCGPLEPDVIERQAAARLRSLAASLDGYESPRALEHQGNDTRKMI